VWTRTLPDLPYRNVKPDYVEAWWNVVNWADVARQFAKARLVVLPNTPMGRRGDDERRQF